MLCKNFLVIYVHGKNVTAEEVEHYKKIFSSNAEDFFLQNFKGRKNCVLFKKNFCDIFAENF